MRSIEATANSGYMRKAGRRPQKARRSLLANVAIGTGLVFAALMTASVVTLATSAKGVSDVEFETSIVRPSVSPGLTAPVMLSERNLEISKFSRIESGALDFTSAKSARLPGADAAILAARRPDTAAVKQGLHAAFARAAHAAHEEKFAELAMNRPDAAVIKAALAPAMANLVMLAPRGERSGIDAMPDMVAEVAPPTRVEELRDMPVVEMASLEEEVPVIEQEEAHALPEAGPLPVFRPRTITAAKPEKPNALAAIAAIAPQKPARSRNDDEPTALAFAKPDNPMREPSGRSAPSWPGIGAKVAVYDISAGVVHMPNGTKLEAHSGIGKMRDNPAYTHVKMKGPTPPGTYRLSMREKLFHGVAAIRLTPTDGVAPLGRTGLLAHSFLLRVRGDSHGCVAFAEYDRFLKAFQRGEITHMVIVPKYDGKRPGRGRSGGSGTTLVDLMRGRDT